MSKIKELKNNPDNNVIFADILQQLFPDLKTKYIELFIKLSKQKVLDSHLYKEIKKREWDITKSVNFDNASEYETIFLFILFQEIIGLSNIEVFMKYCEYNEKQQIKNNDVTAVKNFDELLNEVSIVEIRNISKEMKSQIVKLYEDDEWLIVKPLTVNASRKYGANTKWCTTSLTDYHYFHSYTSNAILIYCINKDNGYKVAMYKSLSSKKAELSFWNQEDGRIDSMQTELPMEIQKLLANEVKNCKIPNRDLLTKEEKEKEHKIFPYHENKKSLIVEAANEVAVPAPRIQVRDAEEGDMELEMDADGGVTDEDVPMGEGDMALANEAAIDMEMGMEADTPGIRPMTEERVEYNGPMYAETEAPARPMNNG
jgi:hypothetical protein